MFTAFFRDHLQHNAGICHPETACITTQSASIFAYKNVITDIEACTFIGLSAEKVRLFTGFVRLLTRYYI